MNTNDKGNIGLIKVIEDFIQNGYFTFLPFTDTTIVDLVASNKSMDLKKVQVKYKKLQKGCICLSTQRVIDRKKVDTDISKFDYYAIFCPDTNKVYYVSTIYLFGRKSINLRVHKSKLNQKKAFYASDFETIPIW